MARNRKSDRRRSATPPPLDALDWQERHSPTARSEVLLRGARQPIGVRRRICDIRLWDGLDQPQQEALLTLAHIVEVIAGGCRMRGMKLGQRVQGGAGQPDLASIEFDRWCRWSRDARQQGIDHDVLMRLIVDGASLRAIETARGVAKHGWARQHLVAALDLWIELATTGRPRTTQHRETPRRIGIWHAPGAIQRHQPTAAAEAS